VLSVLPVIMALRRERAAQLVRCPITSQQRGEVLANRVQLDGAPLAMQGLLVLSVPLLIGQSLASPAAVCVRIITTGLKRRSLRAQDAPLVIGLRLHPHIVLNVLLVITAQALESRVKLVLRIISERSRQLLLVPLARLATRVRLVQQHVMRRRSTASGGDAEDSRMMELNKVCEAIKD